MPKGNSGKDGSGKPDVPAPPPEPIERLDLFEVKERGTRLLTNKSMPKVGDFTLDDVKLIVERAESTGRLSDAQRAVAIAEHNEQRIKRLHWDINSALSSNLTDNEYSRLHDVYVKLQRDNRDAYEVVNRARRLERHVQSVTRELERDRSTWRRR
jgi:hypothetical protein